LRQAQWQSKAGFNLVDRDKMRFVRNACEHGRICREI
jgi:hypothetical protein